MDILYGYMLYAISLATVGGIYAILCLGLNIQWGFTGLFNVGIAGFFAVGAYVFAILTTQPTDSHLGGYEFPIVVGLLAAMIVSGFVGFLVAKIAIRLRSDYLAIASIGIAEIIRLSLKNESWATNGTRGITKIPRLFEWIPAPWSHLIFMAIVLLIVYGIYLLAERARKSPWGRVMVAIRENEEASRSLGKNVESLRTQSFIIGSAIMGLAGGMMAQYLKFFGPNVSEPTSITFLVWVMLIVGGSANNKGAIIGAFVMWIVWSFTEILVGFLPDDWSLRTAYMRVFLIGLCLQFFLQKYPHGMFPEVRNSSKKTDSS